MSDPLMSYAFQAYFSQPMVAAAVIVHLVTDGTYYGDQKQETISVQLLDTKDQSHDLGEQVPSGLTCCRDLVPQLPTRRHEGQLRLGSSVPFPLCSQCGILMPSSQDVSVCREEPESDRYRDEGQRDSPPFTSVASFCQSPLSNLSIPSHMTLQRPWGGRLSQGRFPLYMWDPGSQGSSS